MAFLTADTPSNWLPIEKTLSSTSAKRRIAQSTPDRSCTPPRTLLNRGRAKFSSTSSTDAPRALNAHARLNAVHVFPSPAVGLVTKIRRGLHQFPLSNRSATF